MSGQNKMSSSKDKNFRPEVHQVDEKWCFLCGWTDDENVIVNHSNVIVNNSKVIVNNSESEYPGSCSNNFKNDLVSNSCEQENCSNSSEVLDDNTDDLGDYLITKLHLDVIEDQSSIQKDKENALVLDERRLEKCPFCKQVYFCCQDHFKIHRPDDICFPFVIKRSQKKGRFMVATRNIDPLELILTEEPAVVGPYSKSCSGCLECFRKLPDHTNDGGQNKKNSSSKKPYICSSCHFPMCDEKCERGPLHRDECAFFTRQLEREKEENGADPSGSFSGSDILPRPASSHVCITPLRMLLKKRSDPATYAKIDMLLDHVRERSESQSKVNLQMLKVILLIREACSMQQFSHTEIQRMVGILRTNGMKLESAEHGPDKGCPGVALYPIYCLINHACYNNTNYVKFPDMHLELRSQVPIRKGEEIFTRYISSTIGNIRRREDIRRYWFFDCECLRCLDPSELGTYMSAVRCLTCRTGYLLPKQPLEYNPDWVCNNCHVVIEHKTVDEVISTIEEQLGDPSCHMAVETLEEMLYHYQKLLHPNHYILTDIMHNLVHLYAAKQVLSRPEKERKIQLCLIVLDTLGRVDPGYTKWRGTILQELIHPLMMISKEDHCAGRISEAVFHRRLAYCSRRLKEAKMCLRGGFTSIEEYSKEPSASPKVARKKLMEAIRARVGVKEKVDAENVDGEKRKQETRVAENGTL